ncbi:MAG: hypothetical protein JW847_01985 [Candidatus Omnitrophica bacterium]|nr:hypothetical protein [Candidatus Omnitrophota bacterium]
MKTRVLRKGAVFISALMMAAILSAEQDAAVSGKSEANTELLKIVDTKLGEKTVQSGTLDIFDSKSNQVRNLRLMKLYDDAVEKEEGYLFVADYRDVSTGDIVTVDIELIPGQGDYEIKGFQIKEVKPIEEGVSKEEKEYTDTEIRDFMRGYIAKQGQFNNGRIMLFDEDAGKMRHLELVELKDEVRRMGAFYSSSSKFKDADTGDVLDIDISVEKNRGNLKIQALRIRDMRKGPVENSTAP